MYKIKNVWVNQNIKFLIRLKRLDFFSDYRKFFYYQYRLTKFILKFYQFTSFELVVWQEFTLKNILYRSQLLINYIFINDLITTQSVFVNNRLVFNSNLLILNNFDFIQLIVSNQFFLYFR